jgi:hypothetical protein
MTYCLASFAKRRLFFFFLETTSGFDYYFLVSGGVLVVISLSIRFCLQLDLHPCEQYLSFLDAGLATETNAKDDKEGVEAALELAAALVHVTNDNPMRAAILKNLQNGVTPGGF